MTNPTLCLTPRRTALLADHDNTLDVLVRVEAPDMPPEQAATRQPLNIALVIDRSGSMSGQPLHEARRCAEFVIDGLTPADHASLVIYDNRIETLVPARPLTDRELFRQAIRSIGSGGSTDLHGGWLRGAETLAPLAESKATSRVILLSDGCANHGLTGTSEIATQCRELAAAGVTTSTYGLGRHFNEELMVEMARAGQGNHYYGQTAEDLMDPFREEFALLNALCAKKLLLTLQPADGVRMEVLNDYMKTGEFTWCLPDLAYGSEAWALVRLHLTKAQVEALGAGEGMTLLTASVRYDDMAGEPRAIQPQSFGLPAVTAAAFGAVSEDALVKRRVEELEAARIQQEARDAALRHDWATVDRLLKRVRDLGAENEWIGKVADELGNLARLRDREVFSKESMYASRRMTSRLVAPNESDADFSRLDVPDYLRRKSAQGKRDPDRPS